ncbi:tetratricopeptide repeat protein [uncultured Desulfosarcina sp.]|uniref:tetratricopeptide repeat protein n=1 Tax=uncultured Desulfosarcina sp. TaxID=218289 RepID=UPI0029C762E1|nr:tetratricopeptide repeat protein [uncultured Desulfosarcina sp.]
MTASGESQVNRLLEKGQRLEAGADFQSAVDLYQQALAISPDDARVLGRLGAIAYRAGQLSRAETFYLRAADREPGYWAHHKGLGNVYKRQGRLAEAESSLRQAIALSPESAEVHYDLGIVHQIGGRLEKALAGYRSAIDCDPEHAPAWNNLGLVYLDLGERDKAIDCLQTAIAKKPDFAGAYNNLGMAFMETGQFKKAIEMSRKFVALDPKSHAGYHNMGNALLKMDCYQQAITCFEQGLGKQKDHPEILNSLGVAYQKNGEPERAIACFQKVVERKPDSQKSYIHLYNQLRQVCDWTNAAKISEVIDKLTESSLISERKPSEPPFMSICRDMDEARHLQIARLWSRDIERQANEPKFFEKLSPPKRHPRILRIGYLTNNFRNHPTTHLLCDVFRMHDRSRFSVNAYSCSSRSSNTYAKIVHENCDCFTELFLMNDRDAAKKIADDGIDILVDLNGYSDGHRMPICALRPAPIQVRYLGMAGTTGGSFFDYMIGDSIITPDSSAQNYSEKFVHMPHTYQVNSYRSHNDRACSPVHEKDWPEEGFTFCCFCSNYKLEPELFETWMRILNRVPDSYLWLLSESRSVSENLRRAANLFGVSPDRIRFGQKETKEKHLSRLGKAHLALDTRAVNGAATTSDALWAGVPVITIKGRHFASRMSASILTAIGLPELIADNLERYENLAVELATDKDRLNALRDKLKKNRSSKPLFDSQRFVRNLENAFEQMWRIHIAGEPPQQITVVESEYDFK